jgi:hypothetical protein
MKFMLYAILICALALTAQARNLEIYWVDVGAVRHHREPRGSL